MQTFRYLKKGVLKISKSVSRLDLVILFVCIASILVFYIAFKRNVVFITARFKVTDDNALYANTLPGNEYATSFVEGDTEKDELGRTVSEIIDVETYKVKENQAVVYLDIKMKAVYNPRKKQYTVRGKTLSFGESFTFTLSKVKFKGLVVDFPGFRDTQNMKKITMKVIAQLRDPSRFFSDTYGVPLYIANAVKRGDVVTDSKGNVLLTVLDVLIKPAKRIITNTQTVQTLDPELKDVYYTIELPAVQIRGQNYMFNYFPVLIGSFLPINLPSVSISPTIIEILE